MTNDDWLAATYIEHKDGLVRCAWNITRNSGAAEDAVHTAFASMAKRSKRPDDPKLFAYRSVRNAALNVQRSASRRPTLQSEFDETELAKPEAHNDADPDCDLERAIKLLPIKSQEIIELHLQSRLTFQEIGETTELPTQTVASRYRRAIEKLRSLLQDKQP